MLLILNMFDPIKVCEQGRCCIKLKDTSEESCSICLESKHNKRVKYLKCKHSFHVKCINTWLQKSDVCPLCRCSVRELTLEDLINKILNDLLVFHDESSALEEWMRN